MPDKNANFIEQMSDEALYTVSDLLRALKQAREMTGHSIPTERRVIARREKNGISVYQNNHSRVKGKGYRVYTGAEIKKIVSYEIGRKAGNDPKPGSN